MKSITSLWLLVCLPFYVSAAVINVPDEYDTIQAGIDAADTGDTVLVAPGTYMGEGNKNLLCNSGEAIVLISEGGPEVTAIDCENDGTGIAFENGEGEDTIFAGFTIENGFDETGGGIFCYETAPTIENCIITGNDPHGIQTRWGSGSTYISECIISGNAKRGLMIDSDVLIYDCTISGNNRGGVYIVGSSPIDIIGCEIIDNNGTSGGGIFVRGHGGRVSDSVITGNHVSYMGGGVGVGWLGGISIKDCVISGNSSILGGGIGASYSNSTYVYNTVVSDNFAAEGGGIYRGANSIVNIRHATIIDNEATESGGGVSSVGSSYAASTLVCNTVIPGNAAYECWGDEFNRCESNLPVENSILLEGVASEAGGNVFARIFPASLNAMPSLAKMTGSIVWGNMPDNVAGDWRITYSDIQGGHPGEGNIDEDPLFEYAGDYHIPWSSPCVDTSIDLGLYRDLDGDPRPLGGGFDMGADEANPQGPAVWVSPTFLDVMAIIDDQVPEDTLIIVNGGSDTLTYSAWPDTGSWLTLAGETAGAPGAGDTTMIFLQYDISDLDLGSTSFDTVTVGSDDPFNPEIQIPVQIHITALELRVPEDYGTIQAAIDAAVLDGAVVLVAEGTYTAAGNKNLNLRGKAITVSADSASAPGQTIIDCENDGRGFYIHRNESMDAVIDGFTIKNGNTDLGGGMLIGNNSSPSVRNCFFEDNYASIEGGGLYCFGSAPVIEACVFSANEAENGGGLTITQNWGEVAVHGCLIENNVAADKGGGLKLFSKYLLTNCVIAGNTATIGGGIYESCASLSTNCTITANHASSEGGGIYREYGGNRQMEVENSIIWNNSPDQVAGDWDHLSITSSDIQDGYPGTGNIDLDPLFVSPGENDYHLLWNSPCIDAGTDAGVYIDYDGDPRPMGAGFDMGYDEFYRDGVWFAICPSFFEPYCVYPELAVNEDTLLIVSGGTEDLTYTITPGIEPWLSIAGDLDGTLAPGDSASVNLTYSLADMVPGSYTDTLIAVSNDPLRPEVIIPVMLEIDPPILVDVSCDNPYVMAGEDLQFRVSLSNLLSQEKQFQAWLDVYLDTGEPYAHNPVDGPEWITLEGGQVLGGPYRLSIFPGAPPGGPYSLCLTAGGFPTLISDEACFDFYIEE